MTALLSVDRLRKAFGGTVALSEGSFEVRPGEVHAVMGENGAGKSTMLGIVAGLARADGGEMKLAGARYAPGSAAEARRSGVAIVPQEPTLCGHLTVAENVVLGVEAARFGLIDAPQRDALAARALAPLGVEIGLSRLGLELSPAERQIVSIARALAQSSVRVLILDEPTSSLTLAEADKVIEAVRVLASSGVCVLYVSHTLGEVVRVADSFTVLRNGKTVHSGPMEGTSLRDLTTMLLGHPEAPRPKHAAAEADVALRVTSLAGARLPRDVSFELHRGEVLGVFGLMGSGRTELVRALFGLDRITRGEVRFGSGSKAATRATPAGRLAARVGMVSEDRKGEGLALTMSVADNLTLTSLEPFGALGFVAPGKQEAKAQKLIDELGIKAPGPTAPVSALSGGNQQKVALGRLLHHDVDVLLLDEPTRGIDIKSREQLYDVVEGLAKRGKAVLWISSQPAELLRVCDRVAVMRRGALGPARQATELDEGALLEEAAR